MKTNIIIFILIASFAYATTLYLESRKPAVRIAPQNPMEETSRQPAPDFAFTAIDGKTHNLKDFKGTPIILNFWASWCPPCIKELPLLMRAAQENDIILIALSSDIDQNAMIKFLKKQELDTPPDNVFFAFDEGQSVTQKTFQTFKLPETIIIDPKLNMRAKLIGADWDYEALLTTLKNL